MNKPASPEKPRLGSVLPANPDAFDRSLHAAMARYTAGLSPIALSQAWWDWAAHLAASPGRRMELLASAATKSAALMSGPAAGGYADKAGSDVRFDDDAWRSWPFSFWAAAHKAQGDIGLAWAKSRP